MIALERILPRASVQYGAAKALYSHGQWLSYSQIADRVYRLAGAFVTMGIKPGDRIAVLDSNSPEYIETYYAAAHIGAVLVAINSRLSVPELDYILRDCTPSCLVVGSPFLPHLEQLHAHKSAPSNVAVIGVSVAGTERYEGLLDEAPPVPQPRASRPEELTAIYYTSGTTGEPKGVCLTYANMSASALDVIVGLELGRTDVWLHAAPLFHLVDAWAVWALPMIGAAQATVQFTPEAFFSICQAADVTHVALPPTLIGLLCDRLKSQTADLSSLKKIMYGGSPMPPTILEEAQRLMSAELLNSYGTTETSGTLTLVNDAVLASEQGAGSPVVSVVVDVVDDGGASLPPKVRGEIVVSGPRVMAGYWNKPKATKDAIVNCRYHTGDIGYFDESGNLFIVDRKKDMIISGGENVYSVEVEAVLAAHPSVQECAVIGVPHERWVEAVHAVVVLTPGQKLEANELIAFCRGKIAPYKIPKSVSIVAEKLPRSATGKIVKHKIRGWYSENPENQSKSV